MIFLMQIYDATNTTKERRKMILDTLTPLYIKVEKKKKLICTRLYFKYSGLFVCVCVCVCVCVYVGVLCGVYM